MIELKFLYQLPRTEESNGTMVFKVMGSMFIHTVSIPVTTGPVDRVICGLRNGKTGWIKVSEDYMVMEDINNVMFHVEMSILNEKLPYLLKAFMMPPMREMTGDDYEVWAKSEMDMILGNIAGWYGTCRDVLNDNCPRIKYIRPADLFISDVTSCHKEEAIGLVHYQKPDLEPAKGDNVVVTDDGFVWMVISKDEAYRLFDLEEREIYRLYDDNSDAIIESEDQIDTHEGRFAIEVGKVDDIKKEGNGNKGR